jgi:transketolase
VAESERPAIEALAAELRAARERLDAHGRKPREDGPRVETIYSRAAEAADGPPPELTLAPGTKTTLRGELGKVLNFYNRESGGAIFAAAADLLDSTSVSGANKGFPGGYFHPDTNPGSRLLSIGGICEDAMSGVLSGLSSYRRHIGVGSSYGAFIAPLGHIASRLHAIGAQARREIADDPYPTMILICAHAGLKTGEDGPTHADPQPLQLLQENFPPETAITLTPWEPQEVWYLLSAALARRPALIYPFVTRPTEKVPDREALGFAPASVAVKGVYRLRAANGGGDGTIVLQGSGVTYAFVEETLPRLESEGIDLDVYLITSAELFDTLSPSEREEIFPEAKGREAMGITGFSPPTLYRWVTSERGRAASLWPFRKGRFLGSGQAPKVLREAGLDGEGQFEAIRRFVGTAVSRR